MKEWQLRVLEIVRREAIAAAREGKGTRALHEILQDAEKLVRLFEESNKMGEHK